MARRHQDACAPPGLSNARYLRGGCPFFSSWDKTEPASFFASLGVGFFAPESTLLASVEVLEVDCFFANFVTPNARHRRGRDCFGSL